MTFELRPTALTASLFAGVIIGFIQAAIALSLASLIFPARWPPPFTR